MVSSTSQLAQYVIFRVNQQRYALHLENVTRALRMVAIMPLPDAPVWVIGAINISGKILPVIDLRLRIGKKSREVAIDDRLLVLKIHGQDAALAVDEVFDVLERSSDQMEIPTDTLTESGFLEATFQQEGEIVLVLDASRLLSREGYFEPENI